MSTPAPSQSGGLGGDHPPAAFIPHIRSDLSVILKTMEDHGARGIPIPERLVQAAVAAAAQALGSQSERVRAAGLRFIHGALALNLDRVVNADKIARLDGGLPTERQEVVGDVKLDLIDAARRDREILGALMDRADREDAARALPKPATEPEPSEPDGDA